MNALQNPVALLGRLLIAALLAIGTGIRYYFVTKLGERVVADIRRAVFDRVMGMSPAFFERLLTGGGTDLVGIGGQKAQLIIVFFTRALGRVDGTVPELVFFRQAGRRQKLPIAHAAQRPIPFAHGLGAQIEAKKRQRPLQTRIFPRRLHFRQT